MLEVLIKPFFLLQYIVCIALIVENSLVFAILNLGFSVITTTINYILTYLSYKKIKTMAEHAIDVQVLRNGAFAQIPSNQLVPGDIINPNEEIMCDCIVLRGELYVNEASLTGENVPIGKFPASTLEESKENSRWLFEGSKVV
jgi:cation-transporting ATPase 13A3/4/5